MIKHILMAAIACCALSAPAAAHDMSAMTPNSLSQNALPNATGQHAAYGNDKWAFSYDYTYMRMDGLRDGSDDVSSGEALAQGFMIVPTDMNTQLHRGSVMYQATPRLSLMAMVPYLDKDMDEVDGMGMKSSMHSDGFGDMQLTGHYDVLKTARDDLNISAGLSLPTGSTDESDPVMGRLPYMMQLGSGTYDPLFGLTYTRRYGAWAFGGNASATIRLGTNDESYRFGNEYNASVSASRMLNRTFTGFARLDGSRIDNVHSSDPALDRMMDPSNDPNLQAGERVDAVVGVNLVKPEGVLSGSRSFLEFGVPVYQNVDGPQLETDYHLSAGLSVAF